MPIDMLSKLIPAKDCRLWNEYLQFVAYGEQRFNFEKNRTELKTEKLRLLEKALRCGYSVENSNLAIMQSDFMKNGLSVSLLTDWLTIWKYTATLQPPLNEKQISDIIANASSLLARMIMALNNENPSIYLPLCSLLSAVLFFYLNRNATEFWKTAKWSLKQKRTKLKGWLKNAGVLLSIVRSKKLKFNLALILNRLRIYEKKTQNNKQPEATLLDETWIFLYSIWQFITIRRKSVTIKGI